MEDQYGMGDLRDYIDGVGRPVFPAISQPPDLLSCHRPSYPFDMLIFRPPPDAAAAAPSAAAAGFDSGAGRWPRQETLTLLEIRSRLDPKFREANQKIPLWDEVSRIMSQEYGYQRSGKKCREKFENLYKYYKKTKDGKAGRQDGKHYRFFRQLEALYGGDTTNSSSTNYPYNFPNCNNNQEPYYPVSKDSCDCDTTSSHCTDSNAALEEEDARMGKRRGKMRRLKASIEEKMSAMAEKQDAWMERMTRAIEGKEEERMAREDQWRRQDAARIDGEHKMWAAEKAWIEARDAALMEAFNGLFERGASTAPSPPFQLNGGGSGANDGLFRYLIGDSYQRL